jgi:hypothetical protein
MSLIFHSLLFFIILTTLIWLARRPLHREVEKWKKRGDEMYEIALEYQKDINHGLRDVSRLEQNIKVLADANGDLCRRHLLNQAEVRKLTGDVKARIVAIQFLRSKIDDITSERNALAEELVKRKPKGSRRTASECRRG